METNNSKNKNEVKEHLDFLKKQTQEIRQKLAKLSEQHLTNTSQIKK
jgi:hypothetical protein